ncbi:MAG: hypothetical protein EBU84_01780 [Actinobacteria bacterium]|nr:hypothetical protein [Actinomycetota bacterium]
MDAVATPLDMANARLAEVQRELAEVQRGAARIVETIASALRDEAERRDWCAEYDEFVESVNDDIQSVSLSMSSDSARRLLATMRLAPLTREYEVTHVVTLTFTQTVRARSENDALEWCDNNYNVEDALARREWDDYEVTEVTADEQ